MNTRHLVAKAKAGILSSRGGNSFIKSFTLIRPPISSNMKTLLAYYCYTSWESNPPFLTNMKTLLLAWYEIGDRWQIDHIAHIANDISAIITLTVLNIIRACSCRPAQSKCKYSK